MIDRTTQSPEELAVLRWIDRIRDGMRTSMNTHCNNILPQESQVRHDVDKTLCRCIDQLTRLLDYEYGHVDRNG